MRAPFLCHVELRPAAFYPDTITLFGDRQEWKQQIIPAKAISNKDGADWIFAPRKYLNSSLLVMLAIVWRGLASVLLYPRETSRRATVSFGRRGF